MTDYRFAATAVLIAALSGCAPLQQAPLVYSSKVSVGVDVSATMTEQPGVSMNLGYKQVDAAYVPVAVAKKCEREKASDSPACEKDIYKLMPIIAYNDASDSKLPEHSISEAKKHVDELLVLLKGRDAAYANLTAQNAAIDAAKTQKTEIEKDPTYVSALGKTASERTDDEKKKVDQYEQARTKSNATTEAAKQELERATKDLQAFVAKPEVKNLAIDIKLISASNAKQDAYSVFGSFDGSTTANAGADGTGKPKGEASLVIGKVFSTGVASQNLTEGMKAFYQGKGGNACLQQGEQYKQDYAKLIDSTTPEGKNMLASFSLKIVEMCTKALDLEASAKKTDTPK